MLELLSFEPTDEGRVLLKRRRRATGERSDLTYVLSAVESLLLRSEHGPWPLAVEPEDHDRLLEELKVSIELAKEVVQ